MSKEWYGRVMRSSLESSEWCFFSRIIFLSIFSPYFFILFCGNFRRRGVIMSIWGFYLRPKSLPNHYVDENGSHGNAISMCCPQPLPRVVIKAKARGTTAWVQSKALSRIGRVATAEEENKRGETVGWLLGKRRKWHFYSHNKVVLLCEHRYWLPRTNLV